MDKPENDVFAFDLENRLDDFFKEKSSTEPHREDRSNAAPAPSEISEHPLQELKSIILAIDWEITDEGLTALIGQSDTLLHRFSSDNKASTLLKMLKSLGVYIRKYKSKAPPDAIKRLMAAYSCLETIMENNALSDAEKKQMLREEIVQFKKFKKNIAPQRSSAASSGRSVKTDASIPLDTVMSAIDALRSTMEMELSAIRKEVAKLRKK